MVRMRINRSATRKRRSHHGLSEPRLSECKECGAKYLRHRACNECGKYRGRLVEDVQAKNTKKAAKRIARIEGAMQEQDVETNTKEKEVKSVKKDTKKTTTKKATKSAEKSTKKEKKILPTYPT